MVRQIINRNQSSHIQAYEYNGRPIMFNKDSGYNFSDSELMDDTVNHFLSLDGFELVNGNNIPKIEPKVVVEEKVVKTDSEIKDKSEETEVKEIKSVINNRKDKKKRR